MRKLKLQMNISLDGYVAGPNGESDWMIFSPREKVPERINELADSSDTILLGRKMTDNFIDFWSKVADDPEHAKHSFAQKMVNIPKIVFSKTVEESKWVNTIVANGDLVEEVEKLKNGDGKDIIVYGGATFVHSLIKNRLIDEYHFFVNPVAIGAGMSPFGDAEERLRLRLVKSEALASGIVELCYEPAAENI